LKEKRKSIRGKKEERGKKTTSHCFPNERKKNIPREGREKRGGERPLPCGGVPGGEGGTKRKKKKEGGPKGCFWLLGLVEVGNVVLPPLPMKGVKMVGKGEKRGVLFGLLAEKSKKEEEKRGGKESLLFINLGARGEGRRKKPEEKRGGKEGKADDDPATEKKKKRGEGGKMEFSPSSRMIHVGGIR